MTTTTDLRLLARVAIAEAGPDPADTLIARAAKVLRERTGCGLAEVVSAIRMELEIPLRAADLPDGSVVADADCAWFKAYPSRWAMANGLPDRYVDEALKAGATVLRVGTGN